MYAITTIAKQINATEPRTAARVRTSTDDEGFASSIKLSSDSVDTLFSFSFPEKNGMKF